VPVEPYPGPRDTNTSDHEWTHGSEVAVLVASGDSQTQRKGHAQDVAAPLLFLITALLVGVRPGQVPAPWFDEGWVISVARNWVTLGHCGEVNGGVPGPANILNIGFPLIGAVAASIRLFGLGMTQARLPCMLYTLAAHVAMYVLVRKLWDERTALATWALLLFATPLLPVWWGRQVLGEMPSAFFLVTGYLCLYLGLGRHRRLAWAAGCLLALACVTKLQCLPFVVVGLCTGFALARHHDQRPAAKVVGTAAAGWFVFMLAIVGLQDALLGHTLGGGPDSGILSLTAAAVSWRSRLAALANLAVYALPTLLGAAFSLGRELALREHNRDAMQRHIIRLILAATVLSWLLWFVSISIGWHRYLVVPVFLGAPFLCDLLSRWTYTFRLGPTLSLAARCLRRQTNRRAGLSALAALLLICLSAAICLRAIFADYSAPEDQSLSQVVQLINGSTPPDAKLETYEMEVIALIDRRVSYPPPQQTMDLVRSRFVSGAAPPAYDAPASDPGYLVTGPEWMLYPELYEPVIADGSFRLLAAFGDYTVYERAP